MTQEHPNLAVFSKLNLQDLDTSASLFSNDFVWHYFNPKLPDIEGDYIGVDKLKEFFASLAKKTNGTFKVEPISATPVGDELVFVQTRNTMQFEGKGLEGVELKDNAIAIDVALVFRIVEGKIKEVWDIPSAFTLAA